MKYIKTALSVIIILVFSIVTSYFGVKLISKAQSLGIRKAFLIITISVQVVLLVSFKLVNYYVSLFSRLLQLPGDGRFQLFRIAAPLGMSYYSLQIILNVFADCPMDIANNDQKSLGIILIDY